MKILLLNIALIISVADCIACKCSFTNALENFMWADFVATVEITQGYIESEESLTFNIDEYWIKTKPIEVLKGIVPDSLKVTGGGMCVLGLKTSTEWIIYAVVNQEGILEVSYCSGSKQLDIYEHFSGPISENVKNSYKLAIEKEINQLQILKRNNIKYTHPYLSVTSYELWDQLEAYKGISLADEFAIFEIEFTENLIVKDVKVIDGFDSKLDTELRKLISESIFVEAGSVKAQKDNFRWLIGIYYYPKEDDNSSFLSRWLL
jgi:hypothetical protein